MCDSIIMRVMDPRHGDCSDLSCLADRVWALLLQVSFDRAHRAFGATTAELDLAPAQAMALQELESERPLSMNELAKRLRCHPSNITGLVDRLEARGLVERRPDPRDRRVKGLALTSAGAKMRECLFARLYSAPRSVAELSQPDQRALRDVLQRILSVASV